MFSVPGTHARDGFDETGLHGMQGVQQAAGVALIDRHADGEIAACHALRGDDGDFEVAAEAAAHAAQHEDHDEGGDAAEHGGDGEPQDQIGVEGLLDVVHVHAADDVPVPRGEAQREAGFGDRLIMAGFGPQIFDEAAAVVVTGVDDVDVQMIAGRIGELGHVFAVEFGLDGVHQHDRLRVVDGDVAVFAVAQ